MMHRHEETFAINNLFTGAHEDTAVSGLFSDQAPSETNDDARHETERGGFAVNIGVRSEAVAAALRRFDFAPEDASLLSLIPLVRTAWAEGVVTRRERQLILEAARLHGIEPGSRAHERLAGWLDFEPTAEFYENSLMLLRASLHDLSSDESERSRLNTVALCAQVAETSGGGPTHTGGGRRICDEEVQAVKHIAAELSGAGGRDAPDCLRLAEATGVTDVSTLHDLRELGYTPENVRALPLVPLVEVAWAEGNVTRGERRIVTTAARLRGIRPGDEAYVRLIEWLDAKPSDDFFMRSFRALRTTFGLLPPGLREVDEWDLLSFCEHVAAASNINSGFSDLNSRVCDEERALLASFAARLGGGHPNRAPST